MNVGIFSAALAALIALSIPIAAILYLVALLLDQTSSSIPLDVALGQIAWTSNTNFILVAVPMFIFMGELMLRSGIADGMFEALSRWLARLPGGLMHANIAASALFAATSGSSVATAATITTVATPSMERGGYNKSLFLGSIAAGGTLGILIPPSINMIVYGVLAEVSVRSLYFAGLLPGLLLAFLFSVTILVIVLLRPALDGKEPHVPLRQMLAGLPHLLPPIALFLVVVGSIYLGLATPTESAALGLVAVFAMAAARRRLTWQVFFHACHATMRTTAMVLLITAGAFFLNFVLSSTGVNDVITDSIAGLDLPPVMTLCVIIVIYLALGCFMETLSLMVATTPIVVPVIVALGFDPVWFGVVFIILIEAALITPPIGVNLFVVQSVYRKAQFHEIARGALVFLFAMFVVIGILIAFPDLALWLPRTAFG